MVIRIEFVSCGINLKIIHNKRHTTCLGLLKTALKNVVLRTLFNVVNNIVQQC